MLTLHAMGGPNMLEAAVDAVEKIERAPLLLAVTVLTSMDPDQLAAIGIDRSPAQQVQQLAATAHAAGIRGFVCSPQEAGHLRNYFPSATLVVPGIRPVGAEVGDQKRVASPGGAIAAGADYLVIGRPITRAADPVQAVRAIIAEMHETMPLVDGD
jgi:orotidine-5'-phosphate decarboxylase